MLQLYEHFGRSRTRCRYEKSYMPSPDGRLLMRIAIILASLVLLQASVLCAQNPYIREGSIGKQREETGTSCRDSLAFCPIEKWVGKKFIFLPIQKSHQQYGYQQFTGGQGEFGWPTYEECVGRIGTIVNVSVHYRDSKITIQMDDNGQTYVGSGDDETVMGIAPVADINYARSTSLGKTLWYRGRKLDTYNEATEEFGEIELRKYSAVKVLDVVAGWVSFKPVRLILQTPSGEEAFKDVTLSRTNGPSPNSSVKWYPPDDPGFSENFFVKNPHKTRKWSLRTWSAIEEGKVFLGMTAEQVRMSWGKPEEINKTITGNIRHEQWVYGIGHYLYFDNGILTGIQN